ncbi:MAG: hypothetical protein II453_20880 [Alphaproteobacteria bacterium]|jgi:hypothetical protein|nr:hypothetical protein [Alphaproteobacteria bacterium]
MYNQQIEELISAALADGVLTEKEKQILFKKAQGMGIDLDEFEMVLDARLVELKKKEQNESSAPKSTKYGDVRKCPVCGALVPALAGSCPDCGYEFSGIDAAKSVKDLSEKLEKVGDSINKKKDIIESFPVPNTKGDIVALILYAKPHLTAINDELSNSFYKKYIECISKAKVSFPEDKFVKPLIVESVSISKKFHQTRNIQQIKNFFSFIIQQIKNLFSFIGSYFTLLIIPALIITTILYFSFRETDGDRLIKVAEMAEKGNVEDAKLIYEKMGRISFDYRKEEEKAQIAIFQKLFEKDVKQAAAFAKGYHSLRSQVREKFLESGNIEEYWELVNLDYSDATSANKRHYYMEKIVRYYCEKGEKVKARKFINQNIEWFKLKIDNDKSSGGFFSPKIDKNFSYNNVKSALMSVVNSY